MKIVRVVAPPQPQILWSFACHTELSATPENNFILLAPGK